MKPVPGAKKVGNRCSKLFTSVVRILKCEGVKMMKRPGIGKMEEQTYKGKDGKVFGGWGTD